MKIDFDDLIRQGEDIKALRYLAKELYKNNMIGGTRKRLLDRVADEYEKMEENEAYSSLRAIELIKENENLKQEIENLKEEIDNLMKEILYIDNDVVDEAITRIEENENLKQEIENLKYKVQYLTDCGIEKEHQYKEALLKCSPYTKTHTRWIECIFCGMDEHTNDCEYVRLCGTDINVGIKKEA